VAQEVTREGFLLLRQWRDARDGLRLELWAAAAQEPLHITLTGQRAVMFIERSVQSAAGQRREVDLLSLDGAPVDALYFETQRALVAERERLLDAQALPMEADVKPVERFLMERFITGGLRVSGPATLRAGVLHMVDPKVVQCDYLPELRLLSIDIETDGFEGPLLSIAGVGDAQERVFIVDAGVGQGARLDAGPAVITRHRTPADAIDAFVEWVAALDPDVIVGWNVIEFDLQYLIDVCAQRGGGLALGRAGGRAEVLPPRNTSQPHVARVPGRVVLDGIATLRSATFSFESFALDDVAQVLLGRRKHIDHGADRVEEIRRMAAEDPAALAEYNLEDCRLVLDIFDKAKLVQFAVERQRLTGLPMDRQGGSVAAFDQLYLPRLHRAGHVAPSVGGGGQQAASPGGYVMDSEPGLFRNVLVLDFKSLYPSIIRTFHVDPLGLARAGPDGVEGFEGARFAREGHILPELIATLWAARDQAKRDGNLAMSQAIKIMMNSFYGVLGTPGCRFFDHRLVSSITLRGHDIILRCRRFIEEHGLRVIYGDTDSVFVALDEALDDAACDRVGRDLAEELTVHFRTLLRETMDIDSHLELEFETHYRRFLMPTMRGSEVGTKKRYAGSVIDGDGNVALIFKGLEAVRTDWTPLARGFQQELFRRVFADEPYEQFVAQVGDDLRAGRLDDQLVYRKRLRRNLDDYVRNVPPHVQAARQLERPGRHVQYVITLRGPQPIEKVEAPLDYQHYLDRQLAPAADTILHFLGTSFAQLAGTQMSLF